MEKPGAIAVFGSGETSSSGRKVHAYLLEKLPSPARVAILDTPAGFQPNAALVAEKVKVFFEQHLSGIPLEVFIVKARARGTVFDPDNPALVDPLLDATYIFMGPGSPTYAARSLRGTRALANIAERHRDGAILALASAAAVASGSYVLPVYEIYKAGHDLHWEPGLDLFREHGLDLAIVTHWDNTDGGEEVDTSRCYVGEARFSLLRRMLPATTVVLGIDEHTSCVVDFAAKQCVVMGQGSITLLAGESQWSHKSGASFAIEELRGRR